MPELKISKPATREEWMQRFIDAARPLFKAAGYPLPKKVRCSVGFPSKGVRAKTIGECWYASASGDKVSEIFLRPSLQDDSKRIADVLTHELCHAALPEGEGHGKLFRRLATTMGLEGKMTETVAGKRWHDLFDPIVKELGKFPGAKLEGQLVGGKKKQTTRMIKLECDQCGWTCRTTEKHIDEHDAMTCPLLGCGGELGRS